MSIVTIKLTKPTNRLKGELSKYLQEIDSNVFVGKVSARVAIEIWAKVVDDIIMTGSAVMTMSDNSLQGYKVFKCNSKRKLIEIDGLPMFTT